jgi:hypothetical protein
MPTNDYLMGVRRQKMHAIDRDLLERVPEDAQIAAGEAQPVRTFRSEPLAAVHELMSGFCSSGAIGRDTMSVFDKACCVPGDRISELQFK